MIALSKIVRVCVAVIFVMLVSLSWGTTFSQTAMREDTSTMSHSVSVIVRTDRERYSPADAVKINASLQNNGGGPIYIDRRMFWTGLGGGLKLDIMDEHGKHLPAHFFSDAIMPPPMEGDASILIRLDQGFFYGNSVNLLVKEFFPAPGRYSIRVTYKSWLRRESVAPQLRSLPAIWEDAPQISSEPIWINVTQ
jgi:hypothetical protein